MFKNYYLILLLGHILGDFYFQTPNMAKAKNKKISVLLIHCLIYFLTIAFIIFFAFQKSGLSALFIVGASHFIIDLGKYLLIKYFNIYEKAGSRAVYAADQLIHLIFTGIGAYTLLESELNVFPFVSKIFENINIDGITALKLALIILIMAKPANITIKELIKLYKPGEQTDIVESNKRTGGFIGILERYIIFILLYVNQYSAVGLVLTAKSIARYHELEDKGFAEYFLMGTLLSTFIIILTYLIVF
ncbi:MAG: DUF3307 domain-containing protein [Clostridiales bacterium]|nr:DUF3307 domain-containing protein [Clostridiales bacterium]